MLVQIPLSIQKYFVDFFSKHLENKLFFRSFISLIFNDQDTDLVLKRKYQRFLLKLRQMYPEIKYLSCWDLTPDGRLRCRIVCTVDLSKDIIVLVKKWKRINNQELSIFYTPINKDLIFQQ